MKKKLLSVLSVSLIFTLIFAMGVSAVTPRWSYVHSIYPGVDKSGDAYLATVACVTDVTRIDVELELYQKGLLGVYTKKASHSGRISGAAGTISASYDMDTNKTYRVDVTVTATTSSGQKETVEVSHTA